MKFTFMERRNYVCNLWHLLLYGTQYLSAATFTLNLLWNAVSFGCNIYFIYLYIMGRSNVCNIYSIFIMELHNWSDFPINQTNRATHKHLLRYKSCTLYLYNYYFLLTLNLLNFLYGIIHLTILAESIIFFFFFGGGISKYKTCWSANSIEPGQTARTCMLTRLYTGDKG